MDSLSISNWKLFWLWRIRANAQKSKCTHVYIIFAIRVLSSVIVLPTLCSLYIAYQWVRQSHGDMRWLPRWIFYSVQHPLPKGKSKRLLYMPSTNLLLIQCSQTTGRICHLPNVLLPVRLYDGRGIEL